MRKQHTFYKQTARDLTRIRAQLPEVCAEITFDDGISNEVRQIVSVLAKHFPLRETLEVRSNFRSWYEENRGSFTDMGELSRSTCACTALHDDGTLAVYLDPKLGRRLNFSVVHEYFHVLQANYLTFRRGRFSVGDEVTAYTFEAAACTLAVTYPADAFWGQTERAALRLRASLADLALDLLPLVDPEPAT